MSIRLYHWKARAAGLFAAWLLTLGAAAPAMAGTITVAVAANFKQAAAEIGQAFEAASGNKVQYAFGATGAFAAQIRNGAPFDVLLAADDTTGPKLAAQGFGDAASGFVYARGTLVLYSTQAPLDDGAAALRKGDFAHLAIADPKTAPYGAAAVEAMQHLNVYSALQGRLVQGSNIGQTFDFVKTGNAQLGFVALSQAIAAGKGHWWVVPQADYKPINQSALLLKHGQGNAVAAAYLHFLRGPQAAAVMRKYGYAVPQA